MPEAPAALEALRSAGKRVLFVTNAGSSTREQLQAGLNAKGYQAEVSEIFGAGYLTAAYLRQHDGLNAGDKVYVSGTAGMAEEIRNHTGLEVLGGGEDNDGVGGTTEDIATELLDPAVRCALTDSQAQNSSYKTITQRY